MAMFEQMRANVGKLLKGIDRSEPGRRERFWPSGVEERISGDLEWWSQSWACPGVGLASHLEEMFKENTIASAYRQEIAVPTTLL